MFSAGGSVQCRQTRLLGAMFTWAAAATQPKFYKAHSLLSSSFVYLRKYGEEKKIQSQVTSDSYKPSFCPGMPIWSCHLWFWTKSQFWAEITEAGGRKSISHLSVPERTLISHCKVCHLTHVKCPSAARTGMIHQQLHQWHYNYQLTNFSTSKGTKKGPLPWTCQCWGTTAHIQSWPRSPQWHLEAALNPVWHLSSQSPLMRSQLPSLTSFENALSLHRCEAGTPHDKTRWRVKQAVAHSVLSLYPLFSGQSHPLKWQNQSCMTYSHIYILRSPRDNSQ